MPRATVWRGMARFVALRWWQRHPLLAVSAVTDPALRQVAQQHPWRLVLGAAAAGSLIALARPWRLAPRGWWWRVALSHGVAASLLLPRPVPRSRQKR